MDNEILEKFVKAIQSSINQCEVSEVDGNLKIIGECIYCGRSARGVPHMGILISIHKDKITGGAHCFRCGTSSTLKQFLFDIKHSLSLVGISEDEINQYVVVINQNLQKAVTLDITIKNKISKNFERTKFYNWIETKYKDKHDELRKKIVLYMNGMLFIKKRLNLTISPTIFNAYHLLKDLRSRVYVGNNDRLILSFGERIRYVFECKEAKPRKFVDELDATIYGNKQFPFIFKDYIKLKSPSTDTKYFWITDNNNQKSEKYDTFNIYVAEGVFDILSMKYYKNFMNLNEINNIDRNICNLYVAVAHNRIDRFIYESFAGIKNGSFKLPVGVNSINFTVIPDLNMNVNRYIFSIYNFIKKNYNVVREIGKTYKIGMYYLDLLDKVGCYDIEEVKDINDVIRVVNKKYLRELGLARIC
jgi:hypothetical protein